MLFPQGDGIQDCTLKRGPRLYAIFVKFYGSSLSRILSCKSIEKSAGIWGPAYGKVHSRQPPPQGRLYRAVCICTALHKSQRNYFRAKIAVRDLLFYAQINIRAEQQTIAETIA